MSDAREQVQDPAQSAVAIPRQGQEGQPRRARVHLAEALSGDRRWRFADAVQAARQLNTGASRS